MFPRVKPLGTNGSSRSSVRESASYPTEVVDYLKLDIYQHLKRGKASDKASGKLRGSLYLYLPPGLNEKYSAKYEGKNLSAVGNAVMDAATAVMDDVIDKTRDPTYALTKRYLLGCLNTENLH